MILIQPKLQQYNQHHLKERKETRIYLKLEIEPERKLSEPI